MMHTEFINREGVKRAEEMRQKWLNYFQVQSAVKEEDNKKNQTNVLQFSTDNKIASNHQFQKTFDTIHEDVTINSSNEVSSTDIFVDSSSYRDELEERLRTEDVLAKISPRYQLQYKIDLALKDLYTANMEDQGDVFENSKYNRDVNNEVTEVLGIDRSVSPACSLEGDENALADDCHYTESEEAPVPKPRQKNKQTEAKDMNTPVNSIPEIQIDYVDSNHPIVSNQIVVTPEYENIPDIMTSSSCDSSSVTSEEGARDSPTGEIVSQDIELVQVNNQDQNDEDKQEQLSMDDVTDNVERSTLNKQEEKGDFEAELLEESNEFKADDSSSDTATSDEDIVCSYDVTIDTNANHEEMLGNLPEDELLIEDRGLYSSVDINSNASDDVINDDVSDTIQQIIHTDPEPSDCVVTQECDKGDTTADVIETNDKNSDYDVIIEGRDKVVATPCNPAELIAPQLAEDVIVSAIKEVAMTSRTTVNDPTVVLEEHSDQISQVETRDRKSDIGEVKLDLNSDKENDTSSVSSSDESTAEEYEKADKVTSDSEVKDSETDNLSINRFAEEDDISTSPEYKEKPKSKDGEIVLLEATKVVSEIDIESSGSLNQEMRIIERTGLVNHDEIPEEENGSAVYSAAHSQRNTDATKWFGQSKPKDKVWLKPSGKVDTDAETERMKVIKAMTRKHNPNYVPKWQPPVIKDFTEDLDEKERKSLERYEERRRNRILSSEDGSIVEEKMEENKTDGSIGENVQLEVTHSSEPPIAPKPVRTPSNSEIVIESVVHSRDAINVWETRLSSKQQKEEDEKKRLAGGKLKRRESEQRKSRERTDSMSSVASSASQSELPSSEFIIRESIEISNVRNRWKDREVKLRDQPSPTAPKLSRRAKSFTVETGSPYRSYSRPSADILPVVNRKSDVTMSRAGESAINREIREAAEREERYRLELKQKALEKELLESAEDAAPPSPTPNNTTKTPPKVAPKTKKSSKSGNNSENGKSTVSEGVIVPKFVRKLTIDDMNIDALSIEQTDTNTASGASSPSVRSDVASPIMNNGRQSLSSIGTSGGHEDEYSSSELSNTSQDDNSQTGSDTAFHRPRQPSFPNVVSPKGWGQKTSTVSPVSPRPKFTIKSMSSNSEIQIPSKEVAVNGTDSKPKPKQETPQKQQAPESPKVVQGNNNLPAGTVKKTITVNRQLSGPIFEVVSSQNRLHTIMEQEMREAKKREEEWKQKQLENRNIIVNSPKPETPVISPQTSHTPTKVLPNGDGKRISTPEPTPEKESQTEVKLRHASSSEYKKNTVVKANRVPRRKSNMAMMWESGNFKNNDD